MRDAYTVYTNNNKHKNNNKYNTDPEGVHLDWANVFYKMQQNTCYIVQSKIK